MIQDIGTHCYHNEYIPVPPKEQDFILCYKEKNVLVKKKNKGQLFATTFL